MSLALAAWLLYAPTLDHQLLPFDDNSYVSLNPHLRGGLDPSSLGWTLRPYDDNWIPLTWVSFALDYELGGLEPRGYHRTNLALHAANSVLVYLAFVALFGSRWRSALVAAIFALHPLHVESVAWVAERKDVLSGFFALLVLWLYARYVRTPQMGRARWAYAGVIVCLALGLMAKPMLVSLPLVLLLLDFWPLRRLGGTPPGVGWRRALVEKLPLFALAAADAAITYRVQQSVGAVAELAEFDLHWRIWNALLSTCAYVVQSFWPRDMAIFYPHPGQDASVPLALGAGVALLTVGLGAWQTRGRWPHVWVGWLWFLVMLAPVIGIVQVGGQSRADRYMYLPQIGLCIALVWSLPAPRSLPSAARAALASAIAAVLCGLAWASHRQLQYWASPVTVFEHAIEITGPSARMHHTLGLSLLEEGRNDAALAHFLEATRRAPGWSRPLAGAGRILGERGEYKEAHRAHLRAVQLEPDSSLIRLGFARTLMDAGQNAGAIPQLNHALKLDQGFNRFLIRMHLGLAFAELGDWRRSEDNYRVALSIEPDSALIHGNLGHTLQRKGEPAKARASYERALELDPSLPDVRSNLALLLFNEGDDEAALAHLQRAIELGEDDASIYYVLYQVQLRRDRRREAIQALRDALRARPSWRMVRNNLAWHLATESDPEIRSPGEALRLAKNAVRAERRAETLDTLAAAQAANGRRDAALASLDEALALAREAGDAGLVEELAANRAAILSGGVPKGQPAP